MHKHTHTFSIDILEREELVDLSLKKWPSLRPTNICSENSAPVAVHIYVKTRGIDLPSREQSNYLLLRAGKAERYIHARSRKA